MVKPQILLVGNGMAGIQCVEEILKIYPNKFDITFLGMEFHPHERMNQNKRVKTFQSWNWYKKNNIKVYLREMVIKIDIEDQMVYTDLNRKIQYDRLILATGSFPRFLSISGTDKKGLLSCQTVEMGPDIQLAKDSGIPVRRGIIVNDFMETGIPNIYAIGECAEHRNIIYRFIEQLQEQGKVLAMRICGRVSNPYEGKNPSAKLTALGLER